MCTLRMFVYRKITKIEHTYKIAVLVMTEIVFVHDQKHVGWTKSLARTQPCYFQFIIKGER